MLDELGFQLSKQDEINNHYQSEKRKNERDCDGCAGVPVQDFAPIQPVQQPDVLQGRSNINDDPDSQ
jgi:hypothetical protein